MTSGPIIHLHNRDVIHTPVRFIVSKQIAICFFSFTLTPP